MVEPVFVYLFGIMNARRFARRGLEKVRLEFSMYLATYNLGRVLSEVDLPVFLALICCETSGRRCVTVGQDILPVPIAEQNRLIPIICCVCASGKLPRTYSVSPNLLLRHPRRPHD